MTAQNEWTYEKLKGFQELYGITNATLAKVLHLDRSTISRWDEREARWKIPINYWAALDIYEEQCRKIEANTSINASFDKVKKVGPLAATLLLGAGPLALVAGVAAYALISKVSDERECPYCAETIKKKAILCKHCHSKVEAVD